ncbi:hypothetical protein PVK06_017660 [Gossypium arboreum]|uniref:Uncharacterized protein n=1 Tax=Gossypium arboreum TaxID=29729 RepID=A0ABR0Q3K7_GOSAR|nr:hypothetical protein PVK06_017660 [Gossypium arboreum]
MSSPGEILNSLATALHGSIRTVPSIHRLRLGLLGYLIPFVPLAFISQCQCRPSRVLLPLVFFLISTYFTAPPKIPSTPTVLQLELADAYSPDTVIASSLGKEVHDPWAFYLHTALLRQAFTYCRKFPIAASRRILGRVSVPVWLIILSDQLLIIALTKPIQNFLSFQGITCIHALHIRLEFAPRNIAIPTPSRQSHEPLIHSYSITAGGKAK